MTARFKYVFGPVPSRRLGRSLGVDLIPFKTCTFDCVYCQLGATTDNTVERKEFVPLDEVIAEVAAKLEAGPKPDYITLAGSGEPTLYARLGELVTAIKAITDTPIAVLTNGSLLADPDVQAALLPVDLVVPSLDAGTADLFERVNRPHPSLQFQTLVDSIVAFRERFHHQLWLEILLVGGGIALEESEFDALAGHAARIRPDKIQLNTVTRPPAESFAEPAPLEQLQRLAARLGPTCEIVSEAEGLRQQAGISTTAADILEMLKRRPCSLEDIANGLSIRPNEAIKHLEHLEAQHAVATKKVGSTTYYTAREA